MKKMLTIFAIFLVFMMTVPAFADLSGYVKAPNTSWTISAATPWKGVVLEDGSLRWWRFFYIENIGSFPLTEAKARIWIWRIKIDGVFYYDAATVDSNLVILNAEKIGSKTYLISLGTIQPGHSRRMLLNVWGSQPMRFWFGISIWYLSE